LLRLLAENGQHFEQLAPNESVTLVVTFRKEPSPEKPGMGASMGGPPAGMPSGPGIGAAGPGLPGLGGPPAPMGASSPSGPPIGASGPGIPGGPMGPGGFGPGDAAGGGSGPSSANDYELLADLHRKRGNWKEVVRVYEETLRKRPRDQERDLSLKLAAAYLELGQVEAARKLLEKIATT